MKQFTIEGPDGERLVVRADEKHTAAVMDYSRYGVVVRPATAEEVQAVIAEEAELEAHEPDVGYAYPDDEACIQMTVKDW